MVNLYPQHKISSAKNKGKIVLFFPAYDTAKAQWMPFPYLYLAPFIERAGFEICIIDARVEPDWEQSLQKELKDAFALGVTSMTGPDLIGAMKASQIARDMNNDICIIWGGHHASVQPEEIFNEDYADFVILGPAEFTFPIVLDSVYLKKELPSDIKGILYKKNGKILGNRHVNAAVFHYPENPSYHLIDVEKYRSKNNVVLYMKSRGCPFKCTFCAIGNFNVSHRLREQYHGDIKYLVEKLKFGAVVFKDPTFFLKASTVMDVAELFHSIGNVRWKGNARGTFHRQYTPEQFAFMKKSGLTSVMFGVESGSQRMLDFMLKKVKREDFIKSAEVTRDLDIEMYASFIFAMPGETIDDFKETISLMREMKKINPNILLQNCIFVPLPATKMFDDAVALGFKPPTTLKGWAERGTSSRFEDRDDITWMKKSVLRLTKQHSTRVCFSNRSCKTGCSGIFNKMA